VYVVGGANSAGQAALNFARYAKRVVMVVRGRQLEDTMSLYLVAQIRSTDNIEVRLRSSVVAAQGQDHLAAITLQTDGAQPEELATSWLFVYIGASPRTDWLGDGVARDPRGFVLTGPDLLASSATSPWPLARTPFALETSVPGVFAAGDVRLDSMKRVASAVGEGAMAIYLVHRYLAST
jgi:thioredoxin reductase (NADPH)